MPKAHNPRRGSMQFWPRKRSRHSITRTRSWASENKAKPLAFIGYKAGMTHILATDNRAKSPSKGESVSLASTIVECPPMVVAGVVFYSHSWRGLTKTATVLASKLDKDLKRKISISKKQHSFDSVSDFHDLRLLVHSKPSKTSIGTKKPKVVEIAVGGSKDDKLAYAKEILGKEIAIADVFEEGSQLDVKGITKGKGFQGAVKRFGVAVRSHKAEKVKRGVGNLGAWTPKRVDFRVAQPGKMGFHSRTEHNKQLLALKEGTEVAPKGGITKFGVPKNICALIKGSVIGPRKRALLMTLPIRPNSKFKKDSFNVVHVSK